MALRVSGIYLKSGFETGCSSDLSTFVSSGIQESTSGVSTKIFTVANALTGRVGTSPPNSPYMKHLIHCLSSSLPQVFL